MGACHAGNLQPPQTASLLQKRSRSSSTVSGMRLPAPAKRVRPAAAVRARLGKDVLLLVDVLLALMLSCVDLTGSAQCCCYFSLFCCCHCDCCGGGVLLLLLLLPMHLQLLSVAPVLLLQLCCCCLCLLAAAVAAAAAAATLFYSAST